jgi:hypothetical protein
MDKPALHYFYKNPIAGVAGDQQAALFGQLCTEPGMVKTLTERMLHAHEYWRQTCLF